MSTNNLHLRCIDPNTSLTLDKVYRGRLAGDGFFTVINDKQQEEDYFEHRFAIVSPVASPASEAAMLLPTDPAERKSIPICTGVLDYFPLALAEVARVSKAGNDQHNPGQPLHWDRTKSLDHADCIPRHLIDRFARDSDGQRHAAKMAWRSLAFLQTLLEDEAKAKEAQS